MCIVTLSISRTVLVLVSVQFESLLLRGELLLGIFSDSTIAQCISFLSNSVLTVCCMFYSAVCMQPVFTQQNPFHSSFRFSCLCQDVCFHTCIHSQNNFITIFCYSALIGNNIEDGQPHRCLLISSLFYDSSLEHSW